MPRGENLFPSAYLPGFTVLVAYVACSLLTTGYETGFRGHFSVASSPGKPRGLPNVLNPTCEAVATSPVSAENSGHHRKE